MADRSQLARRLAERQWVTSVELVPPRGYDLGSLVQKSKTLRQRGVTAINIPDGPLASYHNALFMKNEVPGVIVPDSIMQRMASVESREGQMAMGIEIARESVVRIRDRVAGIQVSAPLGKVETALAVIE